MAQYSTNFEDGTVGTTVASGFDAATTAFKYRDDWAAHGGLSAGYNSSDGAVQAYGRWALSDSYTVASFREYIEYSVTNTTNSLAIIRFRGSSDTVNVLGVYFNANGYLRVGSGLSDNYWTAPSLLTTGVGYYCQGWVDTSGTARIQVCQQSDDSVALDSGLLTNTFGSGTTLSNVYVGKHDSNAYTGNIRWDDVEVRTGPDASTSTFIGPVAEAPTVTTNWFRRTGGTWKALDNPQIL